MFRTDSLLVSDVIMYSNHPISCSFFLRVQYRHRQKDRLCYLGSDLPRRVSYVKCLSSGPSCPPLSLQPRFRFLAPRGQRGRLQRGNNKMIPRGSPQIPHRSPRGRDAQWSEQTANHATKEKGWDTRCRPLHNSGIGWTKCKKGRIMNLLW